MSAEHTELPWKVGRNAYRDTVYDKWGRRVLLAESEEDAAFAADAANEYEELQEENERLKDENSRLNEVSVNLLRSRDAAVEDADAMRKLVRRFRDMCNHLPPLLTGVALMEAEVQDVKKMEKPAVISSGYKRIAELMGAAYLALGEEPDSALGKVEGEE